MSTYKFSRNLYAPQYFEARDKPHQAQVQESDPAALCEKGSHFWMGNGETRSARDARKCWMRAAKDGCPEALYHLGMSELYRVDGWRKPRADFLIAGILLISALEKGGPESHYCESARSAVEAIAGNCEILRDEFLAAGRAAAKADGNSLAVMGPTNPEGAKNSPGAKENNLVLGS